MFHRRTTTTTAATGWGGVAIRLALTLLGAAGLIIGAFLEWVGTVDGIDLGIEAFFNTDFGEAGNFVSTVGFVSIVLGLIAIVGLAPRSGWLTRLAGALAIVGFVLFLIQLYQVEGDGSAPELGAWLAVVGGVIALIGGFFGTRPSVAAVPAATTVEPAP